MTIMALPLVILYAMSVFLVWLIRHKGEQAREAEAAARAAAAEAAEPIVGDLLDGEDAVAQETQEGERLPRNLPLIL